MSADRALRLAASLAVMAGAVTLSIGALIGPLGLAVVALTLIGAWFFGDHARSTTRGTRPLVAIGVIAFGLVDLLYFTGSAFDTCVRWLVLLVLVRLVTAGRPRDVRDAGMLAFFLPVASAAVTAGAGFIFGFIAYLIAGTYTMLLAHEQIEAERGGAATAAAHPVAPGLIGLGLAASAASLLTALGLFFVIPRVGEATVALRIATRRTLVGFSDRVELGEIGELETDETPALRVYLADGPLAPDLLPRLRWRGVALDRFDGRGWSTESRRRMSAQRAPGGDLVIGARRGRSRLVTQEVFLEPIGTAAIFAAPRAVRLRMPGGVLVDDMGAISVPTPQARLQYTVESEVDGGWPERLGRGDDERYLQLPPLPPRIPALARQLTAGAATAGARAEALITFLSRDFRYELKLDRTTTLPPLEEFLFVRRAGNCEYFATALAVMLRSLDIPARVVTGFQRGEWNPYGQYFLVRMGDAHAWVEAYLPGTGWTALDPSPRGAAGTLTTSSGAGLYLDALRLRWYRYIVNWSQQDQARIALTLGQAARTVQPWRVAWQGRSVSARALPPLVALLAGVAAWLVWRRVDVRAARSARAAVPDFYRRALRLLARRGLRPTPDETAREFSVRVQAALPTHAEPFAAITVAYEAVRFGAATLAPAEAAHVDAWLGTLAHLRPDPR